MKLLAKIKKSNDNIKFLGIEYNPNNLKQGVYLLYLLENYFNTCQYDDWFQNIENTKQIANEDFGIEEDSWNIIEK